MSDAAARTAQELQMLETLVDGGYALGVAFCEAAKAEADRDAKLALFDAFQRASLAVRMGIRLSLTLRAPPRPAASPERERAEAAERLEREPPETERLEPLESERERERDYEPVSLPRFLATLGVVAAEAERLPAKVTAQTLPTLRELLARARPDAPLRPIPSTAVVTVAELTRPPPAAHRSALLTSAAPPPRPTGPPRPPPRTSRSR